MPPLESWRVVGVAVGPQIVQDALRTGRRLPRGSVRKPAIGAISTERAMTSDLPGVHAEPLALPGGILDAAARFADDRGTVLLLSGGDQPGARHHVLGIWPRVTVAGGRTGGTVSVDGRDESYDGDPFPVLAGLLRRFRLPPQDELPLTGGLLGYLAYDLGSRVEAVPRTAVDDLGLPWLLLFAPSVLVVQDRASGEARLLQPAWPGVDARATRERFLAALHGPEPRKTAAPATRPAPDVTPDASVSRVGYEAAVRRILEHVAAGDVYQVNYAQRFRAPFAGDAFDLLRRLHADNPAAFFAFVQAGDHQVVSSSPERFLQRRGRRVESRPIKGTRPRGDTQEADAALRDELLASEKDAAELLMIVDLVRNDLGKVCRPGSVRVPEHRRLETYRNVHHLVSVVTGELADGRDTVDLVRAAFPAGSITGCPKPRAMQVIDALETRARHVYCGSIGYLGFDDTADLSVAIRTATVMGGTVSWSVGGGIVADSDPAAEYAESLHKGRTLAAAVGAAPDTEAGPWCWHDGALVPEREAAVPVTDLGLLRGFGLFETMRADGGRVPLLADHLARLAASWRTLMPSPPPDLDWATIVARVIAANDLVDVPARVRLVATRGTRTTPPWDHRLTIMAGRYVHRLAAYGVEALALATYPQPRQTPLAAHKTLSYIYNNQAGEWAGARGCHEALVLNPDGTVSEGNSTGILVVRGRVVTRPESPAALPSVMAAAVCRQLAAWGYTVSTAPVHPDELPAADLVLATSGMMGAVPVGSLDGRPCRTDSDLWRRLNDAIIPGWNRDLDRDADPQA
jgi:para-aminobenzoate synthetase component 1